ncbi:MAG: DUF1553 domain-containing protein [Burkholderiaceae bacterium]
MTVYDSDHRSLYLMLQTQPPPSLPRAVRCRRSRTMSVPQRLPTTTPTQTLYLMNSPFVHQQAEAFAHRLMEAPGDDATRVRLAFNMANGRVPSDAETS